MKNLTRWVLTAMACCGVARGLEAQMHSFGDKERAASRSASSREASEVQSVDWEAAAQPEPLWGAEPDIVATPTDGACGANGAAGHAASLGYPGALKHHGSNCGCTAGEPVCVGYPRLFRVYSPCQHGTCGTDPCCTTIFGELFCCMKERMNALRQCSFGTDGCGCGGDCDCSGSACGTGSLFGGATAGCGGGTGFGFGGAGCTTPSVGFGAGCEPNCGIADASVSGCTSSWGDSCASDCATSTGCFQDLFRPRCGRRGLSSGGLTRWLFAGLCSNCGAAGGCGCETGGWDAGCDSSSSCGADGACGTNGSCDANGSCGSTGPMMMGDPNPTPASDVPMSYSSPGNQQGTGSSLHYYSQTDAQGRMRYANAPMPRPVVVESPRVARNPSATGSRAPASGRTATGPFPATTRGHNSVPSRSTR